MDMVFNMAIETPVDVIRRLREQSRQESLSRAQRGKAGFLQARQGAAKTEALGAQLGGALSEALAGEEDLEERPEVQQARQRSEWLNVAPDDIQGLKDNIQAAHEAQDYEVGNYLTDRYIEAEKLRLAKLNLAAKQAGDKPKEWKWKHWQTDTRNTLAEQAREEAWIRDINDEEEEQRVADSIVSRAESLWNSWRERGIMIEPERAYSLAAKSASKHFKPGLLDDTFDFEGFRDDFSGSFSVGADKYEGEEDKITTPAPKKKAVPKVGEERNGYRFLGGDPSDATRWKKVGGKVEEPQYRIKTLPSGIQVRIPIKKKSVEGTIDVDDDDRFDID